MSTPFELPLEDGESSPYTGYTRAHWEAVADGLLTSAWRWSTPGGALLDLPGRPSCSGCGPTVWRAMPARSSPPRSAWRARAGTIRTAGWSGTHVVSPPAPAPRAVATPSPGL
ncbi:hypothetical protein GCM10022206_26130 [Streptomyces chiangmaiensis]